MEGVQACNISSMQEQISQHFGTRESFSLIINKVVFM